MKQLVDALPKTENPTSRFALRGHVTHPGQQRLRHSMRAAIWWLLPSDGEFRRASHSLQYYLARQGRRVVLRGGDVTRPFYENHLNWIPDPTPPSEAHPRLPRRLRPRRRRKRKTAATANENSAPGEADLATPPALSDNRNSSRWASSVATRPRSAANDLPGIQPGTRSALEKHPQSFTSSPLSQHPVPAANENPDRPFCLGHPEIRGYINRPGLTPDRIRLPTVREITSPDSASPHLLSSNPRPNPSLDRLLGN